MNSFPSDINSKQLNNSSILGKRKKVREKRSNYLQKWLEKSTQHTLDVIPDYDLHENFSNQMNGNYWNPQYAMYGQRLFNAASDPSVFRYGNPYGYPPEPLSLPVYPPMYCPPPVSSHYPNIPAWGQPNPLKSSHAQPRKNRGVNNSKKNPAPYRKNLGVGIENDLAALQNGQSPNVIKFDPKNNITSSVTGTTIDFASLPPAFNHVADPYNNSGQEDDNSGNQRRFSDPGLAQNQSFDPSHEESLDETESDSSGPGASQVDNRLIMCLVDQINSLKDANRKLHKALHDTRGELEALKQQTAIWRNDTSSNIRQSPQSAHNPLGSPATGMTNTSAIYSPGMLADLVREIRDAARIREEALYAKVRSLLEERNSTNKSQIHSNVSDKSRTNDRLGKLEEELHNLRIHQSRDESLSSPCSIQGFGPLSQSEQERMRLRADLNEERAARLAADAHAHKLEMLVTQLRSKRAAPPPSQAGSINGSAISSTPDTLQMVLGPVTDL